MGDGPLAQDDVGPFLAQHQDARLDPSTQRITCTTTKDNMPPHLPTLIAHWNGKAYKKALREANYDFEQHYPYLVPHKTAKNLLYCTLTKRPVSRQRHAVQGHVQSKRWKRLHEQALAAAATRTESDLPTAREQTNEKMWVPGRDVSSHGESDEESGGASSEEGVQMDEDREEETGEESVFDDSGARKRAVGVGEEDEEDEEEEDAFWYRSRKKTRGEAASPHAALLARLESRERAVTS